MKYINPLYGQNRFWEPGQDEYLFYGTKRFIAA
jgi:hypothetical protein